MANDVISDRKLRFGIVGCGTIGPTHAGAIQQIPDAELVAVADVVFDRAKTTAERYNVPKAYASERELLADPQVDIVCLCTPSGLHGQGAVDALRAGKHVIVEKPMEVTLAACDRMIAAARESGKKLAVISQHRFDAASLLVKDLIDSGKLGRIVLATAEAKWWRTQAYYDSGDWRGTWALDGGGCLMNQGIHTVDLLQWLVGGVSSIYAHTATAAHEKIEVEDVAVAALTFRNGAVGTLVASTAAYDGFPVRIEIYGTEGDAILEGDRIKTITLKSGQTYASEKAASHALSVAKGGTASVKEEATQRDHLAEEGAVWGDAHRAQILDFIRAVRGQGQPLIDGPAGRKAVEIILGVYQSAKTKRPVDL